MTRTMIAVAALLLSLCAGPAGAQCAPGATCPACADGRAFADFDLDGDGAITSAEYYQARGARMAERAKEGGKLKNAGDMPSFEAIDLDGDGTLSAEEFNAHHCASGGHHRRHNDQD